MVHLNPKKSVRIWIETDHRLLLANSMVYGSMQTGELGSGHGERLTINDL